MTDARRDGSDAARPAALTLTLTLSRADAASILTTLGTTPHGHSVSYNGMIALARVADGYADADAALADRIRDLEDEIARLRALGEP